MPRYKDMPLDPGQFMLFGQCVDDALPSDNEVRAFNEVMDCLDYSGLESKCSETGCPPYPPRTMTKVLAYGYCKGLRSSRKIEEALKVDVRFIWLAGGLKPDYSTISRFRKSNGTDFESIFKESVKLCMNAGLVFLNSVSVDGTKIVAAASKKRIYNEQRVEQEMKRVEQILREADEVDRLARIIRDKSKRSTLCRSSSW
jgi:transposase